MIDDYKALLEIVRNKLEFIGFSLREDTEFIAYFSGNSGWEILFEGERYVRPAFNLSVQYSDSEFSIRILMKLFKNYKKPSLDEQLKFLVENHDQIFVYPPPYAKKYEIIDTNETAI